MASVSSGIKNTVNLSAKKLLIDNRWVDSESGSTFPTINPATGEEICQVAEARADDVEKAVAAARRAFERGPWKRMAAAACALFADAGVRRAPTVFAARGFCDTRKRSPYPGARAPA